MQVGREIKFQAWDQETKQMWTWEDIQEAESAMFITFLDVLLQDQFIKRQFTGLRDNNDREVYEGDIVLCDSTSTGKERRVICYDLHQLKYKTVPLVAYHSNAGRGGWTGYEVKYHNEVIGNIYENPELLEAI